MKVSAAKRAECRRAVERCVGVGVPDFVDQVVEMMVAQVEGRRPVDPREVRTWPVQKTLRPGVKGTVAELERFGDALVAVRYRSTGGEPAVRVKTVELDLSALAGMS